MRLRRRLALSRRIHRILRDRLAFLIQEFYTVLRKAYEARQKLNTLLATLYPEYSNAVAIHGLEALNEGAKTLSSAVEVIAGTRNVMGVSAPVLELSKAPESTLALPVEVCNTQAKRRELLETLIVIAEYEKEMIRLGAEIARVKRVVTMLEKSLYQG